MERPDFRRIKAEFSLKDALEHYGIVLRAKNQYELYGECPLPQHPKEGRSSTFKVSKGDKGWGWSCHSESCVTARNLRKGDGSVKKGGDVIEFVMFMEKLSSLSEAGWLIDKWIAGGEEENHVRTEAPQVAPVQVDEAPADVNENPKRYMQAVEEWLFDLLQRKGTQSWEEWVALVTREIKKRLLSSYLNGVNVGRGKSQEFKGPAVHAEVRRAS